MFLPSYQAVLEANSWLPMYIQVYFSSRVPSGKLVSHEDYTIMLICKILQEVESTIDPQDVVSMIAAFNAGDKHKASEINDRLIPLIKAMFLETNPIPVKHAMGLLGMCSADLRLPLCEMEEANAEKLKTALQHYGLLKGQLV